MFFLETGEKFMNNDQLPQRVRVLIIGGGIHGVGVLHDLASRGWKDIHLVEKDTLGAGTSSRSTKLIHGGLRYLKRIRDFGLVTEALHERRILMQLAPDLVHPVEMLFPVLKKGGMPGFMVKIGLFLYDLLAGRARLHRHRRLAAEEVASKAPILDTSLVRKVYSFWDGQTDDLGLVYRIAASAQKLGAGITEGCRAVKMRPTEDGWSVDLIDSAGILHTISALYVVNGAGPWAHQILSDSGIAPVYRAINNKGAHLLVDDIGLKAALFLQSTKGDGRIFFVLPWEGYTLVGTTESLYEGDPDAMKVDDAEVKYLLENVNQFLTRKLKHSEIKRVFAGLRWLAVESGHNISETTRAYSLGEKASRRGLLITLYGGKLTTYRNLSKVIGDRITRHFGDYKPSRTEDPSMWVTSHELPTPRDLLARFESLTN
jgi:glycerol-3-phosphate dehydrogenase